MPLQRRLPKIGFHSMQSQVTAEVRLGELGKLGVEIIDLDALKKGNVVNKNILHAKIISSGEITKAVTIKGIRVTKGARAAIETAGGRIEE